MKKYIKMWFKMGMDTGDRPGSLACEISRPEASQGGLPRRTLWASRSVILDLSRYHFNHDLGVLRF